MTRSILLRISTIALILFALTHGRGEAAVFATFDAAQFDTNGFAYGDFDDFFALDTSEGVLNIDVATDLDGSNGLFGGIGSDLVADFDAATTNLDVTLTVGPNNEASAFRVSLVDNDGVDTGDEHVFEFDISGLTPGVPTTLSHPLNLGPLFTQGAFDQTPGDGIQNYGLRQVQLQSIFDSTDRLNILVESIVLDDPGDPLLIEFTSQSYEAQTQTFSFGTFSPDNQPGALDVSGSTMIINADSAGTGGPSGGFGFNGLNVDFEASDYQIELEAKLLPGNTATNVNLLLGDEDGEDTGPMMGSDDYIFTVPLTNFNETDFSTFTLPLGTGSESAVVTTFGFTNGGDGLQNFDLSQMQIQADGDSGGVLNMEIVRFAIVEIQDSAGDIDGDGDVDGQDFLAIQQGFGTTYDANDLAAWEAAYNSGALSASAVPEPSACCLLLGGVGLASLRRKSRR